MSELDDQVRAAVEQKRRQDQQHSDAEERADELQVREASQRLEQALVRELGPDLIRQMGVRYRPVEESGRLDVAAHFTYGRAQWRLSLANTADWKIEQRRDGDPAAQWHTNLDRWSGPRRGYQGRLKEALLLFMGEVAEQNGAWRPAVWQASAAARPVEQPSPPGRA